MGGSVKEALGIYNLLKRCPATVTAYIDGFAASAASVITGIASGRSFMMNPFSLRSSQLCATGTARTRKDSAVWGRAKVISKQEGA